MGNSEILIEVCVHVVRPGRTLVVGAVALGGTARVPAAF